METDFSRVLSQRDDVFFKVPLARSLLTQHESDFAEALYLEHLYQWGGFSEERPKKRGADDFLRAFSHLAESIREKGFSEEYSPPGLNPEGQLVGGSHRMALCVALSQVRNLPVDIRLQPRDYQTVDFSFSGFRQLGVHDRAIREASIEKINFFRDSHVPLLVIWPRANGYREKIMQILRRKWAYLDRHYEVSLTSRGLSNLVALAYRDEEWCNGPSDLRGKLIDAAGKSGFDTVTMIALEPTPANEMLSLKGEIRDLWAGEFQGVHTTDSWEESLRVFTTLTSPESIAALELTEVKKFMKKQKELARYFSELNKERIGPVGYGVSGSQWLDYFGVRQSNDIDALSFDFFAGAKGLATHNSYITEFGFSPQTILSEPVMHTWTMGKKHIAPWVYARIMEKRAEGKDLASSQGYFRRIDQFDENVHHQAESGEESLARQIGSTDRKQASPFISYLLSSRTLDSQSHLSSSQGRRKHTWLALLYFRLRWKVGAVVRRLPLLLPIGLRTRLGRLVRRVLRLVRGQRT